MNIPFEGESELFSNFKKKFIEIYNHPMFDGGNKKKKKYTIKPFIRIGALFLLFAGIFLVLMNEPGTLGSLIGTFIALIGMWIVFTRWNYEGEDSDDDNKDNK